MFTKVQKVYFGHIDRAGIVYHPHFVDYFHQAHEDFMESLGFDDKNLVEQVGIKIPVVNVNIDYRNPVRSGDRLRIEETVERLGRASMTFRFRAVEQASGTLVAEGTVTRVCVGTDFKATAIPVGMREKLEAHLANA